MIIILNLIIKQNCNNNTFDTSSSLDFVAQTRDVSFFLV